MALLMLLAPLPAACGGDDGGGPTTTPDAQTRYGTFLQVNLTDPSAVLNMPPTTLPSTIDTDSSPLCSTKHDQVDAFSRGRFTAAR